MDSQVDTLMSIVKEREEQIQAQNKVILDLNEQISKAQPITQLEPEPQPTQVQPPTNNL